MCSFIGSLLISLLVVTNQPSGIELFFPDLMTTFFSPFYLVYTWSPRHSLSRFPPAIVLCVQYTQPPPLNPFFFMGDRPAFISSPLFGCIVCAFLKTFIPPKQSTSTPPFLLRFFPRPGWRFFWLRRHSFPSLLTLFRVRVAHGFG